MEVVEWEVNGRERRWEERGEGGGRRERVRGERGAEALSIHTDPLFFFSSSVGMLQLA